MSQQQPASPAPGPSAPTPTAPRAVSFSEYGGPEVLRTDGIDLPEPGPGQARIVVRAAGVNPLDWKIRSGAMSAFVPVALPHVPGLELAGVVDAVGEGVEEVAVGDEVFGPAHAAYATHAVADAHRLARRPAGLPWEAAAALPVASEAALRALTLLNVVSGETLLIHGASGSVGTLATQFALARGARVVGTAGESALARVTGLGATAVTYGDGVEERIRTVAPGGIDAALDLAGGDSVLAVSAELTRSNGRVVSLADPVAAQAHGAVFSPGGPDDDHTVPALAAALALQADGTLSVPVHAVFPLSDAPAAHRAGERGGLSGKILLVPGTDASTAALTR